ncbi:hypothetical protein CDL15_Pgr025523 [Punica granatum]|uniref:Uncharacterized protein n=1 Tax=Punica granatum TaxID=22663 RepID=A0A218W9Y5_PUNGR|nr:hypothetical protein CDL15_Pgr025523 [Punica granatum]
MQKTHIRTHTQPFHLNLHKSRLFRVSSVIFEIISASPNNWETTRRTRIMRN